MTTAPPSPQHQLGTPSARPGFAPGASSSAPAPSIDPVRVLKRYKYALIASLLVGLVFGIGVWQVWLRLAPSYKSFAIFEISTPKTEATAREAGGDENELERYINTQAARMMGENVLQAVVELPTFADQVPSWAKPFMQGSALDTAEARRALQDAVSARPVPDTMHLQLTVTAPTSSDAYTLVKLIREEYLSQLSQVELNEMNKQQDAIRRQIQQLRSQITSLQEDREELLRSEGVDSLDGRAAEALQAVNGINEQLNEVRLQLESLQKQLEIMEKSRDQVNGPVFSDDLRSQVQEQPVILGIKQQISTVETQLRAIEASGTGRRNLVYRRLESQLDSLRVQLEDSLQRELESMFFGRIESFKTMISSFQAQEADLMARKATLKEQLNRLAIVQGQVQDLEGEIEKVRETIATLERDLTNLEALEQQATAAGGRDAFGRDQFLDRVKVVQREEVPDQVAWPKPIVVVPASAMLVVALTGGLIVLRELLDQRVKGPVDISMIPRTRVLGMIPQAVEDPGKFRSVETVFRDHPQGALAEQFRSVRTLLTKRMRQNGYRSVVITSGFPDSGSTTVALNLAFACAAAEQRVLLIDANLRRPRLHQLLGIDDRPGLVDAVSGATSLLDVVRDSGTPMLDVLPVGSAELRVTEKLACPAMDQLLAEAGAEYDAVIVDSAPMVVSGDALALANKCDASMLVIRALSEKRGLVARLRNELNEARGEMLGVLVNGVRASAGGYLRRNMRATHEYQLGARDR